MVGRYVMIDMQKLDDLSELMRLHPEGTHAVFAEGKSEGAWAFDASMLAELIRLARLGLWAREHALPLLRESAEYECYVMCSCKYDAIEVLEKLPKS